MLTLIVAKQPRCGACALAETELRKFTAARIVRFDAARPQSTWPAAVRAKQITGTPTYFLVDAAGKVHGPKKDAQRAETLTAWVERVEGGAAAKPSAKPAAKPARGGFLRGAR